MTAAKVLLSGFADESANSKQAAEQLAVMTALGLQYYSLRFVDLGNGIKNVMKLDQAELSKLKQMNQDYDLSICSIGSPLGKVKIKDVDDGTKNAFIPFAKYLAEDVQHAIKLAHHFETKLIRGFSFYQPRGDSYKPYLQQAADQIGAIADACHKAGVIYGLEIEANLIGQDGDSMSELHRLVNHPGMVLIFDGGNLSSQNLSPLRCYEEYLKMKPGLGWMHVKDYKIDPSLQWHGHVDEDRLRNFVPCDEGDSGHEFIFRDLKTALPTINAKMQKLGVPGFFVDLEPHLKGGGQFGGFSGPDGMGVALRALCRSLDYAGIDYDLRGFDKLKRPWQG